MATNRSGTRSKVSRPSRWSRPKTVGLGPLERRAATELATVLRMEVTVERIDITDDEQIVAVCARDKSRQRIPIVELPLPDPPPKGSAWIAAYRRWARGR